jgi:hypothetical protein
MGLGGIARVLLVVRAPRLEHKGERLKKPETGADYLTNPAGNLDQEVNNDKRLNKEITE